MNNYAIYLDDERYPKSPCAPTGDAWFIARNSVEFFTLIKEYGSPSYVSFDHDLGKDEPDGYQIVKYWVANNLSGNYHLDTNLQFNVHSANPVGAENIRVYMTNALEHLKNR